MALTISGPPLNVEFIDMNGWDASLIDSANVNIYFPASSSPDGGDQRTVSGGGGSVSGGGGGGDTTTGNPSWWYVPPHYDQVDVDFVDTVIGSAFLVNFGTTSTVTGSVYPTGFWGPIVRSI